MMTEQKQVIPEGYKQTEIGIIPIDWNIFKIGELAEVIRGASPRPKGDKRYYGGKVPRLMVEDVTRDGKYVTPIIDFLTDAGSKLSRPCKAGTLTLVCSGTVGVPSILAVDACIHDGFLGLVKLSPKVVTDYLYQFFLTQKEKFNNSATHGGVFTNLTTDGVREFYVALPPSVKEQTAIANALSDVDALISELEKIIAKKQAIKTATMQQLLTGKTRLPEFALREDGTPKGYKQSELGEIPEDWEVESIGNLLSITTGNKNTQDRIDDGIYPFFVRSQTIEKINSYSFDGEAVLTAGDGVGTGKIFHYINGKFDFHQRVYLMYNFGEKLDGYFFYIFFSNNFYSRIMSMTAKSSVDSVRREMISDMKMIVPAKKEQTRMATLLSDMDEEIQTLQQRLNKTRQIKQGMMQELLTGKTRLVKPAREECEHG